jgi:hypothetical protein
MDGGDVNNLHTITLVWHIGRRRAITGRTRRVLWRVLITWSRGEHELWLLHDDRLVFGVFAFLLALSVGGFELVHFHCVLPYHLKDRERLEKVFLELSKLLFP